MDRIVVEMVAVNPGDAGDQPGSQQPVWTERRRCVSCGYSDEQSSGSGPEPRTRVSPGNIENADHPHTDNEKTPIRILDPGKCVNPD